MFGSYLGRAVRSAPSTALPTRPTTGSSSLGVAASAAAAVTRPLTSSRSCGGQKHQRCHSSSKPSSCPPEGPKSNTSTDEAPTTATTATTATAAARSSASALKKGVGRSNGDGEKRPGGRSGGRKKPRDAQQQVVIKGGRDTTASSLPIVPSTQHVEPTHITLSSFFSQHRPISLTSAVPDSSSEASFGAMFDPGSQSSRKQADVIQTLSQTIESFEEASEVKAEKDFRWNMLQNAPPVASEDSVTHLDGAPKQISLEQLVTQFRPFNAPPAPVAYKRREDSRKAQRQELHRRGQEMLEQGLPKPKRRIWSTTLIVSESTFPDGTTSYAVATTPVSRMTESRDKTKTPSSSRATATATAKATATASKRAKRASKVAATPLKSRKMIDPPTKNQSNLQRRIIRQPFLQRMLVKQWRWEQYWQERNERRENGDGKDDNKMVLISVKRQRKLKMKKHKHRKLLRRQRNIRRKLDRN